MKCTFIIERSRDVNLNRNRYKIDRALLGRMNARTLSSYQDPFIEILRLKFPSDVKRSLSDKNLETIFNSVPIPNLSAADVAVIGERLSRGVSYTDSIAGFNYQFPFRQKSLETITVCPQTSESRIFFCNYYVLHSYCSFCLLLEKGGAVHYLPTLLDSLVNVGTQDPSGLSCQAFSRLLSFYIKKGDMRMVKLYIDPIKNFFRNAKIITDTSLDVLADMFEWLTDNGQHQVPDDALPLFDIVAMLADERASVFPSTSAVKIVQSVMGLMRRLNAEALTMAVHCRVIMGEEHVTRIALSLVSDIVAKIREEAPKITVDVTLTEEKKYPEQERVMKSIMAFDTENLFADGFSIVSNTQLPDNMDVSSLYQPPMLTERLGLVSNLISCYPGATAAFLESFEDAILMTPKNAHVYDEIFQFLVLALDLSKAVELPKQFRFLFSDVLFDSRMICSIDDKNTEGLNMLRTMAFKLILLEGPEAVCYALNVAMRHPNLFRELMCRCVDNPTSVSAMVNESLDLVHLIANAMLYYQKLHLDGNVEVASTRLSIFLLISTILRDLDRENQFFVDEYWVDTFASFLFETPARSFILNHFKAFLTKDIEELANLTASKLADVVAIVHQGFPEKRFVILANDLVVTITEVISHQSADFQCFTKMVSAVLDSLHGVDASPESKTYFTNVLQFLSVGTHDYNWKETDFENLSNGITAAFEGNPDPVVFNRLVQIMAGVPLLSCSPTFMIRVPGIALVIIKTYLDHDKFSEVTEFMEGLCRYTQTNSVAMHEGGLDAFLLDVLHQRWFDDTLSEKMTSAILSLFLKIASISSSPDVAVKFVALLSPNSKGIVSKYFWSVLATMNRMVGSRLNCPDGSIVLDSNVVVTGPEKVQLQQGFTFVCWVDIESNMPQFKPVLLNIAASEQHFFRLSVSSNLLFACQRDGKTESTGKVDKSLPLHTWSFLAVNYSISGQLASVTVYLNGDEIGILQMPIPKLLRYPSVISFGGALADSQRPDNQSHLGPAGVYPLMQAKEISALYFRGPLQLERDSAKPYFLYVPEDKSLSSSSSIVNVLIYRCKLTVLLPLFRMMDIKDASNHDVTDSLLELISNSLYLNPANETDFARLDGFRIISALLIQCKPSILSYTTYTRFFSMLQMLRTEILQGDLIQFILGNPEIWIACDNDTQLRVLRHWSRVLFVHNTPKDTFLRILHAMILYYPDDLNANPVQRRTKRNRPSDLSVVECRQYLIDVLLQSSTKEFGEREWNSLCSSCVTCKDEGTVISIAQTLVKMAQIPNSPLNNVASSATFLSNLHKFFRQKSPTVTKLVMESILHMHRNKIITSVSLVAHVEIIITSLNLAVMKQELLDCISESFLQNYPELLPLCFWVAYNISPESIVDFITKTKPSHSFVVSRTWAFWPIVIASQMEESACANILVFLASCGVDQWPVIYNTIQIVAIATDVNSDDFISTFLTQMSSRIMCGEVSATSENLKAFFDIVKHFLFFRDQEEKLENMYNVMKFSPFDEARQPKSPRPFSLAPKELASIVKTSETKRLEASTIVKQIQSIKRLPKVYNFGIRLDERRRWKDFTLCNNCLNIVRSTGYSPAIGLDLVICIFCLKSHPGIVNGHLKSLSLSQSIVSANQALIDLLCFQSMLKGEACPFDPYRSDHFTSNAATALELTAPWNNTALVMMAGEMYVEYVRMHKELASLITPATLTDEDKQELKLFLMDKMDELKDNERIWKRVWSCLSTSRAPWEHARCLPDVPRRLFSAGYSQSPVKVTFTEEKSEPHALDCGNHTEGSHLVKLGYAKSGKLVVFSEHFEFVFDDLTRLKFRYNDIVHISQKNRYSKTKAIEVLMKNGKSYLLAPKTDELILLLQELVEKRPDLGTDPKISIFTKDWVDRKLSTYQYLMTLNDRSGRSFHDLTQYPVFPWLFKNYESEKFDVDDVTLYRDLGRPIGTLNEERLKRLRIAAEEKKGKEIYGSQYDTLYSTTSIVLKWLSHIEPFRSFAGTEKSTFESLENEFKSVTSEADDFRELCPEFFNTPEVLAGVTLPPWAKTPLEFVYLHRKALESDIVSSTIHQWIDLIWGVKSRGRPSAKNDNRFRSELYGGDPIQETIMAEKGIVPKQLFIDPHPARQARKPPMILDGCIRRPLNEDCALLFNTITMPTDDTIEIHFMNSKAILSRYFAHVTPIDGGYRIEGSMGVIGPVQGIPIGSDIQYFPLSDSRLVYLERNLTLLNTTTLTETILYDGRPRMMCISDPWFFTWGKDCLIHVSHLSAPIRPRFSIPYFMPSIRCAAFSNEFHALVIASDTHLLYYSLPDGRAVCSADLEGYVPHKIHVTKSWGFVVVYATAPDGAHYLMTYTVNGALVRRTRLNSAVTHMTSWVTHSGFDILAFSNEKGKLFVCEAFFLKIQAPVVKHLPPVAAIHYARELGVITVVATDTTVVHHPLVYDGE